MAFGRVSRECEQARSELLQAASLIEGFLDFSDVEDPDSASLLSVRVCLQEAKNILTALNVRARVSEKLRTGFTVAVIGKPNAGKSTLVNNLLGRDAALVSNIPGTTRDYLEFFVEFGGFPIVLVDTAGFRLSSDTVEQMGIQKSKERLRAVDLVIWLDEFEHEADNFIPNNVSVLKVISKCDMPNPRRNVDDAILISSHTGEGLDHLFDQIVERAGSFFEHFAGPGLGSERQVDAVQSAIASINRALDPDGLPEELLAEEVRTALSAVGRITGRVDVEDVLDEVFARLCVGK
jgi:tRNA modification GTPase